MFCRRPAPRRPSVGMQPPVESVSGSSRGREAFAEGVSRRIPFPRTGGFFLPVTSHDAQRYTTAYVIELGRIAWSLAERAQRGEPVTELVRDARLLYLGAWREELRRVGRG